MLCQPTLRALLDAITLFSSRIQRILPYDSNPYMADAFAASGSVFITALGVPVPEGVQWFWIGPHAEYDEFFG
ncbi:MAG: hypothetical protein OJF51_003889 [Nitrospira sp.]|jgi:hypothetical protein|nr:MAG: hypothetical protein OJF51_003889 [Nitrospira sp.]